jgi:hypothetical protein
VLLTRKNTSNDVQPGSIENKTAHSFFSRTLNQGLSTSPDFVPHSSPFYRRVGSVADSEKYDCGRHIIKKRYFYLVYFINFYISIKDKVFISIWTNGLMISFKNTLKR